MKNIILAITGASGAPFGVSILKELLKSAAVHLIISSNTFPIIADETGLDWTGETQDKIRKHFGTERLFFHEDRRMESPVASGSFKTDGMLVVPCSMKTLAGIANGYANNLIERAADVTIKEGRRLLLAPREMPFSAIHLENMLKLARLGVVIAPPVPAFYHHPENLDNMIEFITGKILDTFGIEHALFKRWGS
ncbi:MAG: UbiX family flavin prenyltransferase [Nitrospirae bacterium]|nr:UbiX family flavin prenyltransferase [Nitrospirota bacterium]